jgi:hypothetical protein
LIGQGGQEKTAARPVWHTFDADGCGAYQSARYALNAPVPACRFIGGNMKRHQHQEFIRFLKAIEAEVPAGKHVHVVLDNYATHKYSLKSAVGDSQ